MTKQIYQLRLTLLDIKPKVWRSILVNADTLLVDLHRIIQTTMPWTNSHLHQFSDGKNYYSPAEFEVESSKNSRSVKLSKILRTTGAVIIYEYDFGDGWEHEIVLEEIIEEDEKGYVPRCIGGKRNCPPDDCGGPWGYADLLKTIANPKHEEHESMLEWLGGNFDPEYFDISKINKQLKKKDFGCIWL